MKKDLEKIRIIFLIYAALVIVSVAFLTSGNESFLSKGISHFFFLTGLFFSYYIYRIEKKYDRRDNK